MEDACVDILLSIIKYSIFLPNEKTFCLNVALPMCLLVLLSKDVRFRLVYLPTVPTGTNIPTVVHISRKCILLVNILVYLPTVVQVQVPTRPVQCTNSSVDKIKVIPNAFTAVIDFRPL